MLLPRRLTAGVFALKRSPWQTPHDDGRQLERYREFRSESAGVQAFRVARLASTLFAAPTPIAT